MIKACDRRSGIAPVCREQIGDSPERAYQLVWLDIKRQARRPLLGPRQRQVAGLGLAALTLLHLFASCGFTQLDRGFLRSWRGGVAVWLVAVDRAINRSHGASFERTK